VNEKLRPYYPFGRSSSGRAAAPPRARRAAIGVPSAVPLHGAGSSPCGRVGTQDEQPTQVVVIEDLTVEES
jgi:hypothetical protein